MKAQLSNWKGIIKRTWSSLTSFERFTVGSFIILVFVLPFLTWATLEQTRSRSRAEVPSTPPTGPNPTPTPTLINSPTPTPAITPTPQPTLPLPILQNFESGLNGWTLSGLWYLASSETGCPNAYEGNVSAYFGKALGCTYDGGIARGELTSPYFTIPANTTSASLNFYGWYETESAGTSYDRRLIEVKEVGALGWFLAQQLSADTMRQWNVYTVNLNAYISKTIQVRFRFDSMDSYANAYKGWYVDAITIAATPILTQTPTSTPTPQPPIPTPTSTPTPTPTPSPTPTPGPNYTPVLTTSSLPIGRKGKAYTASVKGYDKNKSDTLTMTMTGLAPGLSQSACTTSIASGRKNITCTIKGKPTVVGTYYVNVTLSDNRGGIAIKTYTQIIR